MNTELKISRDSNGNKTVLVKVGENRAFSIQSNHNLNRTHRDGLGRYTLKEVEIYISKFGTYHQKQLLGQQVFEWPLNWKGEEIDVGVSFSDARYLQGEYNIAFNGGVSIGNKRRV